MVGLEGGKSKPLNFFFFKKKKKRKAFEGRSCLGKQLNYALIRGS